MRVQYLIMLVVVVVLVGSTTFGSLIVFDDEVQAPFSSPWQNEIIPDEDFPAYSGSFSIRREEGKSRNGVIFEYADGFSLNSLDGNTTIEFWVNSPHTNSGLGEVTLRIKDGGSATRIMGTRGPGVTWIVDGVAQTGQVMLNQDSNVWQHVTFDLTQNYWIWDGNSNVSVTLDPEEVYDRFAFRGYNDDNWAPYLDTVSLIPEPGTFLLLGLGGLLLWRSSRRRLLPS